MITRYTQVHTCAHTQKYKTKQPNTYKARATHVMLARGKYYISGVLTVSPTLSDAQVDSNAER